jgi:hypothetical protein
VRRAVLALGVLAIAAGCDRTNRNLPGFDIKVSYQPHLEVQRFDIAGWTDGQPAFERALWPQDGRIPDPSGENLIVFLPTSMIGSEIYVRVDGLDGAGVKLGSSGAPEIVTEKLQNLTITLGEPRTCGDGIRHPEAEQCDDGNARSGDGCNNECVVESGWLCEGTPTSCRSCGDGVCSPGEDVCTCASDCLSSSCGDGLCCPATGEVCTCPEDCESTCGDGVCCQPELAGDCADCRCGDGTCEPANGEDPCTCPDDCSSGNPFSPGNGQCCGAAGENTMNSPADCCDSPAPGDGVCCPSETAATSPADCCPSKAMCGDGHCCEGAPGECSGDCCGNVCGDDDCCGAESALSCAIDCCDSCQECSGAGACCADRCAAGASCDYECLGCSCEFDCTSAASCAVICPTGGCDVNCGVASCTVRCADAPPPRKDGGPTGMDSGVSTGGDGGPGFQLVPLGTCVCRGTGCNLDCGTLPLLNCAGDVQACGSCP